MITSPLEQFDILILSIPTSIYFNIFEIPFSISSLFIVISVLSLVLAVVITLLHVIILAVYFKGSSTSSSPAGGTNNPAIMGGGQPKKPRKGNDQKITSEKMEMKEPKPLMDGKDTNFFKETYTLISKLRELALANLPAATGILAGSLLIGGIALYFRSKNVVIPPMENIVEQPQPLKWEDTLIQFFPNTFKTSLPGDSEKKVSNSVIILGDVSRESLNTVTNQPAGAGIGGSSYTAASVNIGQAVPVVTNESSVGAVVKSEIAQGKSPLIRKALPIENSSLTNQVELLDPDLLAVHKASTESTTTSSGAGSSTSGPAINPAPMPTMVDLAPIAANPLPPLDFLNIALRVVTPLPPLPIDAQTGQALAQPAGAGIGGPELPAGAGIVGGPQDSINRTHTFLDSWKSNKLISRSWDLLPNHLRSEPCNKILISYLMFGHLPGVGKTPFTTFDRIVPNHYFDVKLIDNMTHNKYFQPLFIELVKEQLINPNKYMRFGNVKHVDTATYYALSPVNKDKSAETHEQPRISYYPNFMRGLLNGLEKPNYPRSFDMVPTPLWVSAAIQKHLHIVDTESHLYAVPLSVNANQMFCAIPVARFTQAYLDSLIFDAANDEQFSIPMNLFSRLQNLFLQVTQPTQFFNNVQSSITNNSIEVSKSSSTEKYPLGGFEITQFKTKVHLTINLNSIDLSGSYSKTSGLTGPGFGVYDSMFCDQDIINHFLTHHKASGLPEIFRKLTSFWVTHPALRKINPLLFNHEEMAKHIAYNHFPPMDASRLSRESAVPLYLQYFASLNKSEYSQIWRSYNVLAQFVNYNGLQYMNIPLLREFHDTYFIRPIAKPLAIPMFPSEYVIST